MGALITSPKGIASFQICVAAHRSINQKRKYTGEDYEHHPWRVAERAELYGVTQDGVCAAHIHDVFEDVVKGNKEKYLFWSDLIVRNCSPRTLDIGLNLTDVYTKEAYPHLNRRKRHALENARLQNIDSESKTVKLCDIMDNTENVVKDDPDFASIYLAEKDECLRFLVGANPKAWNDALRQIRSLQVQLASRIREKSTTI